MRRSKLTRNPVVVLTRYLLNKPNEGKKKSFWYLINNIKHKRTKKIHIFCLYSSLLQQSSRTSRTSSSRTRRRWLVLRICGTGWRHLPGRSPCLASATIRRSHRSGTARWQTAGWAEVCMEKMEKCHGSEMWMVPEN